MKSTLQPGSEIVPETICLQGVGGVLRILPTINSLQLTINGNIELNS